MNTGSRKSTDGKFVKVLIVVAGIVFGQAVLYGPSLVGQKILLPLDTLTIPGCYLPATSARPQPGPHNVVLFDLVSQFEPARRFAVSEIHQGRFPLWAPYHYGGVPFVWPKYSLFLLLECCIASPVILAWVQLVAALVAGAGMFCFSRNSLDVGFWPATVCAWCYPLTAFFVLWQGYPTGLAVYWLPWLLRSVDKTLRGESPWAPIGLSIATFLVLTSGDLDVAGQTLLGSGIYGIWCWGRTYLGKWFCGKSRWAITGLVLGWSMGFSLAAPHILPLLEYAKTGARMEARGAGTEERPAIGLAALPQVVLPYIYGSTVNGSAFLAPKHEGNLTESTSAAYTGVLATLLVAPLAWCDRSRRSINIFWLCLALFGLSWCLDVPGFVNLLRLPGLNMMSHNRLVFLTSFAILALTAIGLENIIGGKILRRPWFVLPAVLLAGLGGWCLYRSIVLPAPIADPFHFDLQRISMFSLDEITGNEYQIQDWFTLHFSVMAVLCLLGSAGWLLAWTLKINGFRWFPVIALFLVGDLLWFGHGFSTQSDPALYYPGVPALDQIAKSTPGRVIGSDCLPASLAAMQGLRDIRGYDAIDPSRMVNLLKTTAVPGEESPYATIQFLAPQETVVPPNTIRLSRVLDMLNVRYVIFRGVPAPRIHPAFQSNDYWVLVNSNALPRVFIPKSVETVSNSHDELAALASAHFNPSNIAYVESPVELPASCRGTAQIIHETPACVSLAVHMDTPGLVILGDNWDKGWHAYWNNKPVPVLRANYAIRGVVVPAGSGTLEFVYKPMRWMLGLWFAGVATIVLLAWSVTVGIRMLQIKSRSPARSRISPDPDQPH